MKTKVWPYDVPTPGIKDFGDSRCVSSLYDDTRIDRILQRFRVNGVLPDVGKASLPADVVFGGEDFATLRARLDEARAAGITMDDIEAYYTRPVADEADDASSVKVAANDGGQGGSPEQL